MVSPQIKISLNNSTHHIGSLMSLQQMFSVGVIIFEAVAVLFIGIFARSNDTTTLSATNSAFFSNAMTLMLGFNLMYSPFRKLSLFALATLLLVIAVAGQTNILFGTFWDNCFNGFGSSFTLGTTLLIRSIFASLCVLLTTLDFMGLFRYWQVYIIIAPIMTIGFSLNASILLYGLKVFDGGGGLTIFLYSGVCSLMIWVISVRGKINISEYRIKQSYINQTLGLIGVAITLINWPKFNMGGAVVSYINVNTTTVTSVSYLQNSALGNTLIGLSASILLSILFVSAESKEDKLKYKVYIDSFINGGIAIASFQDISQDPVTCLVLATLSTIITLIIHKYFITASDSQSESAFKYIMANYSKIVYRLLFSFLGIIITSIVVATRSGRSPQLLTGNYSSKAGLEIVAFIIVLIVGLCFGAITAIVINIYLSYRKQEEDSRNESELKLSSVCDQIFFCDLHDEMHPIYYDIFEKVNQKEKQKINIAEYTTRVIKQSLLGARENPLRMMSIVKNVETKADPRETRKNIQNEPSQRLEEAIIKPGKQIKIQKSVLKIGESEKIPTLANKQVQRKLQYDQFGSEIQEEDPKHRLSFH